MSGSEVISRIPRPPTLRGKQTQLVFKYIWISVGLAGVGSAYYAYTNIYKHHNRYRTFWTNYDPDQGCKRVNENMAHWEKKMDYWLDTGKWVGPGMAPIPDSEE